jgi:hypothetical protein
VSTPLAQQYSTYLEDAVNRQELKILLLVAGLNSTSLMRRSTLSPTA